MRSTTLTTVQGIGDLFWVYQKTAPHFDAIDLNILCIDMASPIQRRAEAFCGMLPKVRRVRYRKVTSPDYDAVAHTHHRVADVIASAPGPSEYAANAPMEQGIALRDIDPGYPIEEFVALRGVPTSPPAREDYLCVFVAGGKSPITWLPAQWVPVVRRLADRVGTRNVALIGAAWDRAVQGVIGVALRRAGYRVTDHVGRLDLVATLDVIRRARFFLGYQSGLNVLADNYDVPQLMVYFPFLRPMLYTWAKPANVRTRFHAMTFADHPSAAVDSIPLTDV